MTVSTLGQFITNFVPAMPIFKKEATTKARAKVAQRFPFVVDAATAHFVYDPKNYDSVFATALLASSMPHVTNKNAIIELDDAAWARLKGVVYFVGTRPPQLDTVHEGLQVRVFARDVVDTWGNTWTHGRDNVMIMRPEDEDFGALANAVANTLTDLVHSCLAAHDLATNSSALAMWLLTAKLYFAQQSAIADYTRPVGASKEGLQCESNARAALFNLYPKLTAALRAKHGRAIDDAISAITVNCDGDAYAQHLNYCFEVYTKRATREVYPIKINGGIGYCDVKDKAKASARALCKRSRVRLAVTTVKCTEAHYLDVLSIALRHGNTLISYDDFVSVREWRVYSSDRTLRNALMTSIGATNIYDDGVSLRGTTNLER